MRVRIIHICWLGGLENEADKSVDIRTSLGIFNIEKPTQPSIDNLYLLVVKKMKRISQKVPVQGL